MEENLRRKVVHVKAGISTTPSAREEFLSMLDTEIRLAKHELDAMRLNGRVLNAMAEGVITSSEARGLVVMLEQLRKALEHPSRKIINKIRK